VRNINAALMGEFPRGVSCLRPGCLEVITAGCENAERRIEGETRERAVYLTPMSRPQNSEIKVDEKQQQHIH
jgi:hypothetical protein